MDSSLDLELILVGATLASGLIILLYALFDKKKKGRKKMPILLDYAKSFFPILLIVILLRSFVAEPFRIPSGSMIPTLEIGDFILVKKYAYGIKLPIIHKKVLEIAEPKRGDVVVFRFPPNPKINYIKRLIGLPGDVIERTNDKQLIINGKVVNLESTEELVINSGNTMGQHNSGLKLKETLPNGLTHNLLHFPEKLEQGAGKWIVPDGHYFMMGDNRDNSSDSRFWGFVPEENLVGQASLVWMHWNWYDGGDGFQASRIGTSVQ